MIKSIIQHLKAAHHLVSINLVSAVVFAIGAGLAEVHFPFLLYLAGLAIFFIPGLNISYTLEQLAGKKQRISHLILWAAIISIAVTPAAAYVLVSRFGTFGTIRSAALAFSLWWMISLAFWGVSYLANRVSSQTIQFFEWRKYNTLWIGLAVVLLILIVHFVLYPFIPEADGYGNIMMISQFQQNHVISPSDSRPLFLVFIWIINSITRIPLYWLFKAALPIISGLILAVLYFVAARERVKDRSLLLVSTIAFLTFPVVAEEILVVRPQTIFMLIFPVAIYLMQDMMKDKNLRNLFWFFTLIIVAICGFLSHELFLFLLFIILISLVVFLRSFIRRHPIEFVSIALGLVAISVPLMNQLGITRETLSVIHTTSQYITNISFHWWFINHYINVDGIQIGWPGITALYYYGYNLGIFLPAIIFYVLKKPSYIQWKMRPIWIYTIGLFMFLTVAEVLPRFGIAFLPDRAWLFIALIMLFFIPHIFSFKQFRDKNPLINQTIWAMCILSICVGFLVTYLKQGRVSRNEYQASQYLRFSTPPNAVIATQDANNAIVAYFGGRAIYQVSPSFFMGDNITSAINELDLPNNDAITRSQNDQAIVNAKLMLNDDLTQWLSNSGSAINWLNDINLQVNSAQKAYSSLEYLRLNTINPAVYILFSNDKFNSLYNQRDWWKTANYYGADVDKFNHNDHFEKVYDHDGVFIWKFKQ